MKKLLSLLSVLIMVFSLTAVLTACGGEAATGNSGNKGDNAGGSSANKTSTFSINEISFTVNGDFKAGSAIEDAMSFRNDNFSVSVNYHGNTDYTTQEEATRSNASSIGKYHTDATVEVKENNCVYYYTVKGGQLEGLRTEYVVNGVLISVSVSKFTDEAINAITSFKFN